MSAFVWPPFSRECLHAHHARACAHSKRTEHSFNESRSKIASSQCTACFRLHAAVGVAGHSEWTQHSYSTEGGRPDCMGTRMLRQRFTKHAAKRIVLTNMSSLLSHIPHAAIVCAHSHEWTEWLHAAIYAWIPTPLEGVRDHPTHALHGAGVES
jgi:hypothetical protein